MPQTTATTAKATQAPRVHPRRPAKPRAGAAGAGGEARAAEARATVASRVTASAISRRPSRSKRSICQPSSLAIAASGGSGLTATGLPTARSIGRSESESE